MLFDHLVGAGEKRRRNVESERLGALKVEHQLELGWLHDWQVGRLLTLEDATSIKADLTVRVRKPASVAHQAAGRGKLAILVDRGHRMAERQCRKLCDPAVKEWIGANPKCTCPQLGQG